MGLYNVLFPENSRTVPGKRWLNVVMRTLHLCGMGVYTGGVFFDVVSNMIFPSFIITAVTGLIIIAMDLVSNGKWIFQNRGIFIIFKIILIGLLPHVGIFKKWGIMGIIIISSYISHATADVRYYSFFHRKRI